MTAVIVNVVSFDFNVDVEVHNMLRALLYCYVNFEITHDKLQAPVAKLMMIVHMKLSTSQT